LLDVASTEEIEPSAPNEIAHPDEAAQQRYLSAWEDCIPLVKAKHEYDKAKRTADYTAGSHGLTGTFQATYGLDRGEVSDNREGRVVSQDVETDSWSVSVNFSYPIWDGGASGAAVKAARLSAEQARLEYQKTEKSVQAEIAALINKLNVSYRKLDVLKQKIAIEQSKLDIARSRLDDGQISELTFLDERVSFLEARSKYLDELKTYFSTKVDLESKYLD
jgi:outer membrane protein TolC